MLKYYAYTSMFPAKRHELNELIAFVEDLHCELVEYDEQYVRRLIEKITVGNSG
jgi:hypothetical protein